MERGGAARHRTDSEVARPSQTLGHKSRACRLSGQPRQPAAGSRRRAETRQRRPCASHHRRLLFIGDERGRDIGDDSEQRSDLHRRHQSGAEQAQRRKAGQRSSGSLSRQTIFRARFSPTSLRRNSAPRPRSTLPRATMAMERPSRPSSRTPGPPAVERSRSSSSTIRISRPSIPKRNRSPTAIPTVGCLSISARPSRS